MARIMHLALVAALACCLGGCLSKKIMEAGKIHEKMDPTAVFIANDGSMAIMVNTRYYRETFWRGKEKILPGIPPRDRLVLVSPGVIRTQLEGTTATGFTFRKALIIPEETDTTYQSTGWATAYAFRVLPGGFMAPDVDERRLPAAFNQRHAWPATEQILIPVQRRGKIYQVPLEQLQLDSNRTQTRVWIYPVAAPVYAVEYGTAVAIAIPAAVVMVPLGWGLIAIMHYVDVARGGTGFGPPRTP